MSMNDLRPDQSPTAEPKAWLGTDMARAGRRGTGPDRLPARSGTRTARPGEVRDRPVIHAIENELTERHPRTAGAA